MVVSMYLVYKQPRPVFLKHSKRVEAKMDVLQLEEETKTPVVEKEVKVEEEQKEEKREGKGD